MKQRAWIPWAAAGAVAAAAMTLASACGVKTGTEGCSAETCTGCCDASGACIAPVTNAACGASGASCVACGADATCENGACVPSSGSGNDAGGVQCPAPTITAPSGRSDFAMAFDPTGKQVVLFGGDPGVAQMCIPNPQFDGETWFFDTQCGAWTKSDQPGPTPRARSAGTFDTKRRRFLVFGGRFRAGTSGNYTNYNDVWALSFGAAGSGVHAWEQLSTTGTPPPAMSSTAIAYDAKGDRLIVFGGNASASGASYSPNANVWALSLESNAWTELTATNAKPAAREFHSAIVDGQRNRLVIFGGGDANAFTGPFLNDTWAFDLDTHAWTQLAQSGAHPQGRIRGVLAADPQHDRALLFGGHDDGTLGERNDLWSLDLGAGTWTLLRTGDTLNMGGSGFCDFPSNFVNADPGSPERREAEGFVYVDGVGPLMFGGRTDCGVVNDVWTLDPATAEWRNVKQTFTGLSCERSGKTDCTKLCF